MVGISLLGSSGSIGSQTLDVCARHSDRLRVLALSVNSNVKVLYEQALRFGVRHVAVADERLACDPLVSQMREEGIRVGIGAHAVRELAELDDARCVVNALVGSAGLEASYAALRAGKRLALANKESLVVGGELLMPLSQALPMPADAVGPQLLPIDSEHGAVLQCLAGERHLDIDCLWITASGGPFFGYSEKQLEGVALEDSLSHPTWRMGRKITVDSATLMNKGLEVIEAHHLFNMPFDRIRVCVHRQSCVHSMVVFRDGSVKAQLGVADMRIPIQYALSYPERWDGSCETPDFSSLGELTFEKPDTDTFKCLPLALEAGRLGGTAPCAMNAGNEVAVAAFIARRCPFGAIADTVEHVLSRTCAEKVESIPQLREVDLRSRELAEEYLSRL